VSVKDIPLTWAKQKLSDVCNTNSGGTPIRKRKDYFRGDIPWVKSGELTDGLVRDIEEHITEEAIRNSSAKIFPSGTLLIALYGATVGKLGILTRDAATNQAVCAIFPQNGLVAKYLFWYLRYVRSDLIAQAIGGAQPNISQTILKNLDIPIAPSNEQKRIVAEIEKQFSRLDEAVAALKRIKANLKRYKASVLKAAVEGKLTEKWRKEHPDVEPASELLKRILAERRRKWEEAQLAAMRAKNKEPKDNKWKKKYKEPAAVDVMDLSNLPPTWEWVTWETILSYDDGSAFKRGPFGSSLKKSFFVESGYKVYEQYCPINDDCSFGRYYINENKYNELIAFSVRAKDFLISCSGTMGRITQVPDKYEEGVINQALLRVRINNDAISDVYFMSLFRSPYFQKQVYANVTGSAIQNVKGVSDLKAIPLPLSPILEQEVIVNLIEEHMSVIIEIENQVNANLKRAECLRQSILKKAFSGSLLNKSQWMHRGKNEKEIS